MNRIKGQISPMQLLLIGGNCKISARALVKGPPVVQGRRGNKKGGAELVDPYEEFKDEHLDAAEACAKLHTINAAVNLAADLFDHVSISSKTSVLRSGGSRACASSVQVLLH